MLRWPLTVAYLALLVLIAIYGLHRYWLVYLFGKHSRKLQRPQQRYKTLPRVTVQLPMFNEGAVAERIIDAACEIDYPSDRLQIQVLDDSTDESAEIAEQRVQYWTERGIDIQYLHRVNRVGYKAGALSDGTVRSHGRTDRHLRCRLRSAVATSSSAPCITSWTNRSAWCRRAGSHLNRDDSLLTRGQAIFLDGHFLIEHTARNRSGGMDQLQRHRGHLAT